MSAKNGKRTRRTFGSVEDFIKAYCAADSADDVAAKLGMDKKAVQIKASNLRKRGVNLKTFPRPSRINVDELNELVEKCS